MARFVVTSTLRVVYNIEAPRTCSNCGSTKTSSQWYRVGTNHGYHCNRCQMKLVYNPRWHPLTNPKRLAFKGKQVFVDEAPRKGICSLCGVRVGQFHPVTGHYCKTTHMHHLQYDRENPANYTIEVCVSCHKQEHQRLKTNRKCRKWPYFLREAITQELSTYLLFIGLGMADIIKNARYDGNC